MKVELKYQEGKKVLLVTTESDVESMALMAWSEDYEKTIQKAREQESILLLQCNNERAEYRSQ